MEGKIPRAIVLLPLKKGFTNLKVGIRGNEGVRE
jgi:hypothetical protein